MLTVVCDACPGQPGGKDRLPSLIDEIVREALVRAGAVFRDGVLTGRPEPAAA